MHRSRSRRVCLGALLALTSPAALADAVNDSYTVAEGGLLSGVNVLANDGDSFGSTAQTTPQHYDRTAPGGFSLGLLGGLSYRHDGSETTTDSFVYSVLDGSQATVTINITPVNDPPTANNDSFSLAEGGSVTGNVLGNDTDPDSQSLSATVQTGPSHAASFSLSPNGQFSYQHNGNEATSDSFTYQVSDGNGGTDTATVSLSISGVNDPPVAVDDAFTVDEGGTVNGNVLLNDSDPDSDPDDFELDVVSGPSHAADFDLDDDGDFSYTHNGNSATQDSFVYEIDDDDGGTAQATVRITINQINDAPVITGQTPNPLPAEEDSAFTIALANLLVEDEDSNYPQDFSLQLLPGTGYTLQGNNRVNPDPDLSGLLTVNLRVNDGESDSPIFPFRVNLVPVNDPPEILGQDPVTIDEDESVTLTLNMLDVEDPDRPRQNLTLLVDDGPNYSVQGTTVTPDEEFSGQLTVRVRVRDDGSPPATSDPFDFLITVVEVNDVPEITGQRTLSTAEETAIQVTLADLTVVDADNDYPQDFTLRLQDGANYDVQGTTVIPAEDFSGELRVPAIVNDGQDDSDPFSLTITVTNVNDPPVILGQSPLSTPEDTPLTIRPQDLDVDDPDDPVSALVVRIAPGDNYTAQGATLTPAPDFSGTLSVPLTVDDGEAVSEPFTATVTVTPVNDAPVFDGPMPDQQAVEDSPFSFDAGRFFSDVDPGDSLRFSANGLPDTIRIDVNSGVISGTPRLQDAGDYTVTVTATDRDGDSASGSFDLTVTERNRANLALALEAAPRPALVSDAVELRFVVSNLGPQAAEGAFAEADLIGEIQSVTGPAGCEVDAIEGGQRVRCPAGTVNVGVPNTVAVTVRAAGDGDVAVFGNTGVTGPLPIDPSLANNRARLSLAFAQRFSSGALRSLGPAPVLSMAAGDLDGDGFPDIVAGTAADQPTLIWYGTGNRNFEDTPVVIPDLGAAEGVALADLDGDGDLDLVLANADNRPNRVFINEGDRDFSARTLDVNDDSRDVAVADFDGDGAPDLAFANAGRDQVWRNDGDGNFSQAATLANSPSDAIVAADLYGDGLPELIVASRSGPDLVYDNAGGGSGIGFAAPSQVNDGPSADVAAGDLDGDGRPELVFAALPADNQDLAANPVLLNAGNGQFTLLAALGAAPTTGVDIADFDGDGRPDIIFASETGGHQVWRGAASGPVLFAEQIALPGAQHVLAAELNGDEHIDVALADEDAGVDVFLNDSSGNLGLGDSEPPVIQLVGQANMSIPANSTWQDPGATATDNIDGDISDRVEVSGSVSTTLVGTYRLTYTVRDSAGNEADPVTRTVNVAPAAGTGGGGGGGSAGLELVLLGLLLIGREGLRARRRRANMDAGQDGGECT